MNLVPVNTRAYNLTVLPLQGEVRALRGGKVVAASRNARVMYETRLAPVVYFPLADISAELGPASGLQTFCPFKGTASYHDVTLAGETVPNALWTYADALPESEEIRGMGAFMPGIVDIDLGTNTVTPPAYDHISGPVVDWLLREAAYIQTPEAFTAAFAEKLIASGVAVSRVSVMIWSLHPLIAGKNYVWRKAKAEVSTYAPSYEIHDNPAFVQSPLRHVSNGLGGVRQKLGAAYGENSFPIMEDLRAEGATDYVAMPLVFSDGRVHVLSLTCDHPDGFTTANLGLVFECAGMVSRCYEVFSQRENAQSLLETYVGTRSGARVLGGEIRRGDGVEIDAAILFCDLRHSTRLAAEMPRDAYMALLNSFFDICASEAEAHGGEVLKFIGDAVLAVFPAGDTEAGAACAQAVAAARAMAARLTAEAQAEAAIGIAYGEVTYGNVGSRTRLDFTVIGQAANLAARLCDYGKTTGHRIVATGNFVLEGSAARALGAVELHNVATPVEAFAIAAG